jgi:hypothetical protein
MAFKVIVIFFALRRDFENRVNTFKINLLIKSSFEIIEIIP